MSIDSTSTLSTATELAVSGSGMDGAVIGRPVVAGKVVATESCHGSGARPITLLTHPVPAYPACLLSPGAWVFALRRAFTGQGFFIRLMQASLVVVGRSVSAAIAPRLCAKTHHSRQSDRSLASAINCRITPSRVRLSMARSAQTAHSSSS